MQSVLLQLYTIQSEFDDGYDSNDDACPFFVQYMFKVPHDFDKDKLMKIEDCNDVSMPLDKSTNINATVVKQELVTSNAVELTGEVISKPEEAVIV